MKTIKPGQPLHHKLYPDRWGTFISWTVHCHKRCAMVFNPETRTRRYIPQKYVRMRKP